MDLPWDIVIKKYKEYKIRKNNEKKQQQDTNDEDNESSENKNSAPTSEEDMLRRFQMVMSQAKRPKSQSFVKK